MSSDAVHIPLIPAKDKILYPDRDSFMIALQDEGKPDTSKRNNE